MMRKIVILFCVCCILVGLCADAGIVYSAENGTVKVSCGGVFDAEFTKNNEVQTYSINLKSGDQISVAGVAVGNTLRFSLSLLGPTRLILYEPQPPKSAPVLDSVTVSATGIYEVTATNTFGSGSQSYGVGAYTLYVGCVTRDGTVINPGDNVSPTLSASSVTTNLTFSGIGFPGLAPVDFTNAFTNDLTLGQPAKSKIPPTGDAVLGYTFDAAANDNLALSFTRVSGNLNLGLVVLSADNKVVFQASLVTSSELTTKFTLPSDGTYTIGIFRIDLLPPASPEATAFQLTAVLNP